MTPTVLAHRPPTGATLRIALIGLSMIWSTAAAVAAPAEQPAAPAEQPAVRADRPVGEDLLIESTDDSLGARARGWLRRKIVSERDLDSYGLVLDDDWQTHASRQPLVIIVHGFNSTPEKNRSIATAARDAGHPCGTFAYPNDYTIPASAQLLSSELRRLARDYPERRVALVCHSMGGLVARACVEDSLYDPGNVDRLIMIAPPTCGSAIAQFAVGTDLWEHWLARRSGGLWRRARDSVVDGLGEAADELCPGSPFLEELNARPRNPRIAYTVILGTGARISEAEVDWIRESVVGKLAEVPGAKSRAKKVDELLADMDELVAGKGDGVVAVKRGRLAGVDDTLVIPFGHLAVTGEAKTDGIREVHQAVLERLN